MLLKHIILALVFFSVFSCKDVGCWETRFAQATKRYGIDAAFSEFERLRRTNGLFRANCHTVAHAIGEAGYDRFARDHELHANSAMESCAYGFFHGFMQEFVSHGGSPASAQTICNGMPDSSKNQCYHGIGHGIVYASVAASGLLEEPLIKEGIAKCTELFENPYECINGVYGGIALLYFGVHGLQIEPKSGDPVWICRTQRAEYQKRCYDQMVPVVYGLLGEDFVATGRALAAIDDHEIARTTIEHLAFMPIHKEPIHSRDEALVLGGRILNQCRAIGSQFDACAGGFAKSVVFSQLEPEGAAWSRDVCETYLTGEELASCLKMAHQQVEYTYEKKE